MRPRVFFNASVILAGLRSPKGGSGELIRRVKEHKLQGIISEAVLDEVQRHLDQIKIKERQLQKSVSQFLVVASPRLELVEKYSQAVSDLGDAHVFASSEEQRVNYLVSLDKKHILALASKTKKFTVVNPGELIALLTRVKN